MPEKKRFVRVALEAVLPYARSVNSNSPLSCAPQKFHRPISEHDPDCSFALIIIKSAVPPENANRIILNVEEESRLSCKQ